MRRNALKIPSSNRSFHGHDCHSFHVPEQPVVKVQAVEKHSSGAKAPLIFGTYGTTEVVPCYKTWIHSSISAACKAHRVLSTIYGTAEVVPFQSHGFTLSCFRVLLLMGLDRRTIFSTSGYD
jgi:hypothetical protein